MNEEIVRLVCVNLIGTPLCQASVCGIQLVTSTIIIIIIYVRDETPTLLGLVFQRTHKLHLIKIQLCGTLKFTVKAGESADVITLYSNVD